jgi:hypothetical protein
LEELFFFFFFLSYDRRQWFEHREVAKAKVEEAAGDEQT